MHSPLGRCIGQIRHLVAREVAAEARRMPLLCVQAGVCGSTVGSVLLYGRHSNFICPVPMAKVLSELGNSLRTKCWGSLRKTLRHSVYR
jgi:hypothetical protein